MFGLKEVDHLHSQKTRVTKRRHLTGEPREANDMESNVLEVKVMKTMKESHYVEDGGNANKGNKNTYTNDGGEFDQWGKRTDNGRHRCPQSTRKRTEH